MKNRPFSLTAATVAIAAVICLSCSVHTGQPGKISNTPALSPAFTSTPPPAPKTNTVTVWITNGTAVSVITNMLVPAWMTNESRLLQYNPVPMPIKQAVTNSVSL
jgi:hypothetical protein